MFNSINYANYINSIGKKENSQTEPHNMQPLFTPCQRAIQVTRDLSGLAKPVALSERRQQRASLYCPIMGAVQTCRRSTPLKGLFCSNNILPGQRVLLLGTCVLS